jgi:hypothetical protein
MKSFRLKNSNKVLTEHKFEVTTVLKKPVNHNPTPIQPSKRNLRGVSPHQPVRV